MHAVRGNRRRYLWIRLIATRTRVLAAQDEVALLNVLASSPSLLVVAADEAGGSCQEWQDEHGKTNAQ